ncbi:cell envelope integrity protein CreD [Sphingomonas koreensis]|nr:cell envelope integrity protein CreD [Sphingomonas koreensis]
MSIAITSDARTPGSKLLFAVLIAALLAIPLFATYLLVYDREAQSATAQASIAAGWGGPQRIAAPVLVIPYATTATVTGTDNGQSTTRTSTVWRELVLTPDTAQLAARLDPQHRRRSIYDAVVYEALASGRARFSLPADLARLGVEANSLALDRVELRFGLSDARGLVGAPPLVRVGGRPLALQPGGGPAATGGQGFHAWLDAGMLRAQPIVVDFRYAFRGNGSLALIPQGGDTRWTVTSGWSDPSFQGGFLPSEHHESKAGFTATWRVGNLALGSAVATAPTAGDDASAAATADPDQEARVDLVTPVDLYSQVDRSVKYGFLFIGFSFLTFWLFDVIGGVSVATVEYLLVGAGLVLFFVMLLAFAEVVGFAAAYVIAASAIVGLLTAYSAAVLTSWRRAGMIAGLLGALYGVLYVLLSLEAYSLLIGSLLLFAALAAVMFLTRRIDWRGNNAA